MASALAADVVGIKLSANNVARQRPTAFLVNETFFIVLYPPVKQ
jgi:hypothetical protein